MPFLFIALGTLFGWLLARSGATDLGTIQGMFLLTDLHLYGVIGTAVAVATPGFWLLQRVGHTASGQPLQLAVKPWRPGLLSGSALFGVGWALTGLCPGPMFVTVGEGKVWALAALAGALAGVWGLGWWRSRGPDPQLR